jgi:hypothetical protein
MQHLLIKFEQEGDKMTVEYHLDCSVLQAIEGIKIVAEQLQLEPHDIFPFVNN